MDRLKIQGRLSLNIKIVFNILFFFLCGIFLMRQFVIWLKVILKKALKQLLMVRCSLNHQIQKHFGVKLFWIAAMVCTPSNTKMVQFISVVANDFDFDKTFQLMLLVYQRINPQSSLQAVFLRERNLMVVELFDKIVSKIWGKEN